MSFLRLATPGAAALAAVLMAAPASAQAVPPSVGGTVVSGVTVEPVPFPKRMTTKRPCFTGSPDGSGGGRGAADDACVQEVIDDLIALRHAPGYVEQFRRALENCTAWDVEFFNSTAAVRTQEGDLTSSARVEDNHPKTIQACGRARKANDGDRAAKQTLGGGPTFTVVRKADLAPDPELDNTLNAVRGRAGTVTLDCEASGGAGDIRNCREAPGAVADPALVKAAMQLAATYRVEAAEGSVPADPAQTYLFPVPFRFQPAKPGQPQAK